MLMQGIARRVGVGLYTSGIYDIHQVYMKIVMVGMYYLYMQ